MNDTTLVLTIYC